MTRYRPAFGHPIFPRRGRAFTLVELLLAIGVTAMIGGVIVIMIKATSDGSQSQADGRRHLVRMQSIESQVQTYVNKSRAILAAGNGYLVCWLGDGTDPYINPNLSVNLSELAMFQLNTTTNQLTLYTIAWPNGFSSSSIVSNDTVYSASSNWYSTAQTATSTGYFPGRVVANNVTAFNVTLDNATPTQARIATCTVTIDDGVQARTGLIGAAVYNQAAPQ